METAGKMVENEELRAAMKENGIGRPSTRAAIIETLFKRRYIKKERKNILATATGIELIDTINEDLLKSPELTGIWEKKLRDIEAKKYDPAQFIEELKQQIIQIVNNVLRDNSNRKIAITTEEDLKKRIAKKKDAPKAKVKVSQKGGNINENKAANNSTETNPAIEAPPQVIANEPTGQVCPLCGKGTIIKGRTAYGCSRWREGCNYRLPF